MVRPQAVYVNALPRIWRKVSPECETIQLQTVSEFTLSSCRQWVDRQHGRESGSSVNDFDSNIPDVQERDLEFERPPQRLTHVIKGGKPVPSRTCVEESLPILVVGSDSQSCRPGHLGIPKPLLQLSG